MAGDTLLSFAEGEVALIPPSMHHHWEYDPSSADDKGCVHYLMVAFSHSLIQKCIEVFPELRNRFADISFPTEALIFGPESSRTIRQAGTHRSGRATYAAGQYIRYGSLRPPDFARRYCCRSGYEPFCLLYLFQTA